MPTSLRTKIAATAFTLSASFGALAAIGAATASPAAAATHHTTTVHLTRQQLVNSRVGNPIEVGTLEHLLSIH